MLSRLCVIALVSGAAGLVAGLGCSEAPDPGSTETRHTAADGAGSERQGEVPAARADGAITGEFQVGDGTTRFEARTDVRGEPIEIRASSRYGNYGSAETEARYRDGRLTEVRRVELRGAADPTRAGAVDSVVTVLRFDDAGGLVTSEKRIQGRVVTLAANETQSAFRHATSLAMRVAEQWTRDRVAGAEVVAGEYEATLPAASSPGRDVRLVLDSTHRASMHVDYRNGQPPVKQEGIWVGQDSTAALVRFHVLEDQPVHAPAIVFRLEGETLRAVEYDRSAFGNEGLVLSRVARYGVLPGEMIDVAWLWVGFESSGEGAEDGSITVEEPDRYTLLLAPDGRGAVRADCNRGTGPVVTSGRNGVSLGPFALTKMACPPGSLSDRFVSLLGGVASYALRDGELVLELSADSGRMRFRRGE